MLNQQEVVGEQVEDVNVLKQIREDCKKEILQRLVEDGFLSHKFIVEEALNRAFDKVGKYVGDHNVVVQKEEV